MDTLLIQKKIPSVQKWLAYLMAIVLIVSSSYVIVPCIIDSIYTPICYIAIGTLLLGVVGLLFFYLQSSRTLVQVDINGILCLLSGNKKSIAWNDITLAIIGLHYIEVELKSGKKTSISFDQLRYDDLKQVKSKIMEVCEAKNIPYQSAHSGGDE